MSWRLGLIPQETVANARANIVRQAFVGVFGAVLVASVLLLDALETSDQIAESRSLELAGNTVYVATAVGAESAPRIDSATCDGLAAFPQVRRSGGLRFLEYFQIATAPSNSLRLYEGTGSVAVILDPNDEQRFGPEVLISDSARNATGMTPKSKGSPIGSMQINTFSPARHPLGPVMLLVPSRPTNVEECWIEASDRRESIVQLTTLEFLRTGVSVVVRPLVDSGAPAAERNDRFHARRTRHMWIVGGLAAALPGVLTLWFRRQESALYQTLGAGRTVSSVIVGAEALFVLAGSALVGIAVGLSWLAVTGAPRSAAAVGMGSSLRMAAEASVVLLATACVLGRGRLTDQLKER